MCSVYPAALLDGLLGLLDLARLPVSSGQCDRVERLYVADRSRELAARLAVAIDHCDEDAVENVIASLDVLFASIGDPVLRLAVLETRLAMVADPFELEGL